MVHRNIYGCGEYRFNEHSPLYYHFKQSKINIKNEIELKITPHKYIEINTK